MCMTTLSNSSSSKTQLDRMGLLEHMFTVLWWRQPHQEQVAVGRFFSFSFFLCRDCRTSSNTAGLAAPQCTGNDQDSSTCGETPCQGMEGHLTTDFTHVNFFDSKICLNFLFCFVRCWRGVQAGQVHKLLPSRVGGKGGRLLFLGEDQ